MTRAFSQIFILTKSLSEFDPMLPMNHSELVTIGKYFRLGALHRNIVREFLVELKLLHLYCIQMNLIHITITGRVKTKEPYTFSIRLPMTVFVRCKRLGYACFPRKYSLDILHIE